MNKEQALAMLKFIADLYQIINQTGPAAPAPVEPEPEQATNGRVVAHI